MQTDQEIEALKQIAMECRGELLRALEKAQSGHSGGSLSVMDLLVTLFFGEMKMNPKEPSWDERDRLVLSKGHAVPALYTVLAKKGAIPHSELGTLRQINSRLQGSPDRLRLPFVEASTGSLGQGLSIAQGIALGLKLKKNPARAFCILGDGECQEGQVWETAMSAPKFRLNNLIVFLDYNQEQNDGEVEKIMDIRPIADKWRAFRWAVQEIDGHDFRAILGALDRAREETDRPSLIVAQTTTGKGVSFMQKGSGWHGRAPNAEELERALKEISGESKGSA
jgi:transketolase